MYMYEGIVCICTPKQDGRQRREDILSLAGCCLVNSAAKKRVCLRWVNGAD